MLDQDTRKIDYQFYHLLNENKNFNIEHDIKVKLDQLVHDLMKASNVIIYGSPKYTGYFDTLIKYLFFILLLFIFLFFIFFTSLFF